MQKLAAQINVQLKELRVQRHRFLQEIWNSKEAVTISHDLRTPLTAIFGYLDLLEKEETTETAECYLHIIRDVPLFLRQLTRRSISLFCIFIFVKDVKHDCHFKPCA